jgi:hypothetical protein
MKRQSVLWILAGLLGIVLAAVITWATSQLTSQHIGLSSEPISAARALAPPSPEKRSAGGTRSRTTASSHRGGAAGVPKPPSSSSATITTVEATSPAVPEPPLAGGRGQSIEQPTRPEVTPSGGATPRAGSGENGSGDDGHGGGGQARSAPGRDD